MTAVYTPPGTPPPPQFLYDMTRIARSSVGLKYLLADAVQNASVVSLLLVVLSRFTEQNFCIRRLQDDFRPGAGHRDFAVLPELLLCSRDGS